MSIEAHYYASERPHNLPLSELKPIAIRSIHPGESISFVRNVSAGVQQKFTSTALSEDTLKTVVGEEKDWAPGQWEGRNIRNDINTNLAPALDPVTGREVKLVWKAGPKPQK